MPSAAKRFVLEQLARAEIPLAPAPGASLAVHDERLYERLLRDGSLGLGESYMDGWWDAEPLDAVLFRLAEAQVADRFPRDLPLLISVIRSRLFNLQRLHVREVGERHYDLGNDLFAQMLDRRMVYSCGYWADAETLDEAQEAKLDLICRKIGLAPGMRVLDIGSGWGGFLKFAAERYGISGTGVTVSQEQADYANAHCQGLPVHTRLMDYMALEGAFDRVVSIGMFEHVGSRNYRAYLEKVKSLLAPQGLFLLHTIGGNHSVTHGDPWAEKYTFPNGMLPSIAQIGAASEGVFVMEDWHNFGADYDRTLMAWLGNFDAAWPRLAEQYDARFRRMWRYYLSVFAALFRARQINLWQIVFSPQGVAGGYRRVS